MSSKCVVPGGLRPGRKAAGIAVVFAGLLGAVPDCFPVSLEEARIAFIEADDGLTRDSIRVLSRPDPTPAAKPTPAPRTTARTVAPSATPPPRHAASGGKPRPRFVVRHRRHRWRHHRGEFARTHPETAPARASRRGWMTNFFVWWNGFADRHFHGKGRVTVHDA